MEGQSVANGEADWGRKGATTQGVCALGLLQAQGWEARGRHALDQATGWGLGEGSGVRDLGQSQLGDVRVEREVMGWF